MNLRFICDRARHLVCVPYSVDNLHRMAKALGIKRCWFHASTYPHYDIPLRRVAEVTAKCELVTTKELLVMVSNDKLNTQSNGFHAFEWLRGLALGGHRHAKVLLDELSELKRLRQKRPKGKCMVCGEPVALSTSLAKATGLVVCDKPSCRDAMTDAGIV